MIDTSRLLPQKTINYSDRLSHQNGKANEGTPALTSYFISCDRLTNTNFGNFESSPESKLYRLDPYTETTMPKESICVEVHPTHGEPFKSKALPRPEKYLPLKENGSILPGFKLGPILGSSREIIKMKLEEDVNLPGGAHRKRRRKREHSHKSEHTAHIERGMDGQEIPTDYEPSGIPSSNSQYYDTSEYSAPANEDRADYTVAYSSGQSAFTGYNSSTATTQSYYPASGATPVTESGPGYAMRSTSNEELHLQQQSQRTLKSDQAQAPNDNIIVHEIIQGDHLPAQMRKRNIQMYQLQEALDTAKSYGVYGETDPKQLGIREQRRWLSWKAVDGMDEVIPDEESYAYLLNNEDPKEGIAVIHLQPYDSVWQNVVTTFPCSKQRASWRLLPGESRDQRLGEQNASGGSRYELLQQCSD